MTERKVAKTKKVTRKRAVTRKAKPKSVIQMLEDSVIGKPIEIANKTFLASLGVVSTMQTEITKFQSDFEKTFEKLVKDGEKARDRYRANFREFREEVKDFSVDVVEDVVEAKDRVVENVKSAASR